MAKDPTPRETPIPDNPIPPTPTPEPDLPPPSPAAQRALAEAAERRAREEPRELPPELGGRNGPDPVRYGDWEKKGIAVDF